MSFPSRERGLKLLRIIGRITSASSFPSRERGLKPRVYNPQTRLYTVVPLAGTWIETALTGHKKLLSHRRSPRGNKDENVATLDFILFIFTVVLFSDGK